MIDIAEQYQEKYEDFLDLFDHDPEIQLIVFNQLSRGQKDIFELLAACFDELWSWDADFLVADMKTAIRYFANRIRFECVSGGEENLRFS